MDMLYLTSEGEGVSKGRVDRMDESHSAIA